VLVELTVGWIVGEGLGIRDGNGLSVLVDTLGKIVKTDELFDGTNDGYAEAEELGINGETRLKCCWSD